MSFARETTLTFFVMYLSPLMSEVYLLVNCVSMKRRTSRCVSCKRDNSYFLCYVLISPGS